MLKTTPRAALRLECSGCHAAAPDGAWACSACGALLEFVLADREARVAIAALLAARRGSNDPLDRSGVWRFRELLPAIDPASVVTLRENDLPLYEARRGAEYARAARVSYLHQGMNPTGSFKDGGMTVAISDAKARAARIAVCASTGNTSASMAAYAARAGMSALVIVPATGISESKVAQTLDYGAKVIEIDGDFDAALRLVRRLDSRAVALVNSVNPYRIEGQKCAAFVMLESRGWKAPDWLVLPGGNLGNASAYGKGLREAHALGLIDRIPKIVVVQASGAAPFVRALESNTNLVAVKAQTSATAIKIGDPASWQKAKREVLASGGCALAVDDGEIADARAVIGRDGVGCEPASAAALAGLRKLRERGTIGEDDDVVLVLTGHVLKDTAYAAAYHTSAAPFANRIVRATSDLDAAALLRLAGVE